MADFHESFTGRGHIELILGPMFSYKTTELLRRAHVLQRAKKRCLFIKPQIDNRDSATHIVTHDKMREKAMVVPKLSDIPETSWKEYHVLAIDEGQFFEDIVEFADMAANQGKTVLISGCDGTFQRKPFHRILEVIPIAEKITKQHACCVDCGTEASFTLRTTQEKEVDLIGDNDKYQPMCRACFVKY